MHSNGAPVTPLEHTYPAGARVLINTANAAVLPAKQALMQPMALKQQSTSRPGRRLHTPAAHILHQS
jgi:hypothetical protein